jgi:hypothetical protein
VARRAPAHMPPLYPLPCLLFRCSHTYTSAPIYVWGWCCMCVLCGHSGRDTSMHMCAHRDTGAYVWAYCYVCVDMPPDTHARPHTSTHPCWYHDMRAYIVDDSRRHTYACCYHDIRPHAHAATDAGTCVCSCYMCMLLYPQHRAHRLLDKYCLKTASTSSSTDSVFKNSLNTASIEPH